MIDVEKLKDGLKSYFSSPQMGVHVEALSRKFSLNHAAGLVQEAVWVVEVLANDMGLVAAGGAKKKALKEWLDDCIRLPFFLEPFDGKILDWLIDGFVWWYNERHGKDWVEKVRGLL